jgi:hypothetical protein
VLRRRRGPVVEGLKFALEEPFAGRVLGYYSKSRLDIWPEFEGFGKALDGVEAGDRRIATWAEELTELVVD